jgi:hypothetical protein
MLSSSKKFFFKLYITIDSHHCIQHKSAVFNSMVNRLFTIPMSAEKKLKELEKIKQIAKSMDILGNLSTEFIKNTLGKIIYDNLRHLHL